jgi:peptidoglycan hydrolase-like protein with peptidoglycan-binding domain
MPRRLPLPFAILLGSALLPAVLLPPTAAPAGAAVPAPTATTPAAPPAPAGTPHAASGRIRLVVEHAVGSPPAAIIGTQIVVRGIVAPYVAGERVKVSFYRDGRKVQVRTVGLTPTRKGAGQFRLGFSTASAGQVQARAVHYATPAQAQFSGRSPTVRFASPDVSSGARGPAVRVLQSELNALHYVVPLDGLFDEATARAVIAYRKVAGLELVPSTNTQLFRLLARGAGSFHVRFRGDGRHVEADLTRQVLAEIEPHGRVQAIFTMSSGKPSTPTVIGHFRVYSKTPGVNTEGMVDSNYFIAGYAIHGYPEVPNYAASHGCLRVPIPNAASIFSWVRIGTPVDVYHEAGGGSHRVSSHAGP